MEFIIKFCVFTLLIITVFGKSLRVERSADNSSEAKSDSDTDCDCDWRYLKHYEVKGCQVEEENSCGCPKKFICPLNSTAEGTKVCKYRNKEYNIGSKVITTNVCQVCRCRDGLVPHISCISRECPQLDAPSHENCHYVYRRNKCCPVRYECVDTELEGRSENTSVCEYDGKIYPLGSKIYPADDPCQICECNEDWTGINNSSCHQQECLMESHKLQLDEGCIPVYHENRCCPIEFYCPSSHNLKHTSFPSLEALNGSNEESGDHCIFAGQVYQIGEELNINSSCIKCQCQIPPDVTCVHRSCPPPTRGANCVVHNIPGECCPHYECVIRADQSEEIESNFESGCPTPQCAHANCSIETPLGHLCPTCVCKPNVIEEQQLPEQNILQRELEQNREIMEDYFGGNEGESNEYFVELRSFQEQPQNFDNEVVLEKLIELEDHEKFDEDEMSDLKHTGNFEKDGIVLSDDNLQQILDQDPEAKESFESNRQSESNNNNLETNDIELQRLQKRSERSFDATPSSSASQQNLLRQDPSLMQQTEDHEFNENEGAPSEESDEDYDSELESFREKVRHNGQKDNEISDLEPSEDMTSTEFVPNGCPTPMCASATCKIGILPGHHCPTCICKGMGNRQP